ncbi:MAG: NAD(P)/FAD-dependent oxidoreductase [Burkholderiaceae bacterium]
MRELGFKVHLVDAASDVGGIWHWNCYPGARVDSHCNIYQFSFPEIWREFEWREHYPNWAQMREYFYFVDEKLGLSKDISFNTRVQSALWDEARREWTVRCIGHQPITARFVIANLGFAAKPYVPPIDGLDSFEGPVHHTALWPQEGVDLRGKRVAVIGTGASGVQVAQEAALVARQVTVFQRTPNLALPMQQKQFGAEDNRRMREQLPAAFERRGQTFAGFDFDFVPKNAVDLTPQEREAEYERMWQAGGFHFWLGTFQDTLFDEKSNAYAYDFWRRKVLERVKDPAVAEMLAPAEAPHPFGTKRPSLEQWYFEIFNQDNVKLVDMRRTPIRVTARGIVAGDEEIPFDIIVLATGFDAVTGGLTSIDFRGIDGRTFKEAWSDGTRTFLGVATAGFPNLFFGYGPQSPSGFANGPSNAEYQGELIVELVSYLRDRGITRIEPVPEAQEQWRKLIADFWDASLFPRAKSWYTGANIPGKKAESLNFPLGLPTYIAKFKESAANDYAGFALAR